MKTRNGFTLLETPKEIKVYLDKQKITRNINGLQCHHTYEPDYNCWKNTDKKVFAEPHFGRTESLNEWGKTQWNYKDAKGKYIAQHFTVFPDGMIVTGRSLNSTPIGIKGWNTGKVCIEIYGNFDKGKDKMTDAQRKAVIALFGELCRYFKLVPGPNTIRYHAWFTSGGTYLKDYIYGRSRKTCPGTAFFGGNTMDAFKENFLPQVKKYFSNGEVEEFKPYIVRVTADILNVREHSNSSSEIVGKISKGDAYTIVKEDGKWGYLKSGLGWIHLGYTEKI